MQEQNMQEQVDITAMSNADDSKAQNPIENEATSKEEVTPKESTFTQKQVNEIVKSRLERDRARFYKRYGVENNEGLDGLITKARAYEIMDERYAQALAENKEIKEKLAFLESNVDPARYDDVRVFFKGKELDLTGENIATELANHPEWLKQEAVPVPQTTIKVLGNDNTARQPRPSDKDIASKLFGLDHFIKK